MPTRRSPRRLHPALATLIAFGLHAGLLVVARSTRPRSLVWPSRDVEAEIELSLETEAAAQADERLGSAELASSPALTEKVARVHGQRVRAAVAMVGAASADGAAVPPGAEEPAGEVGAAPVTHPIDLGLNGGVRRTAVLDGWGEPAAKPRASADGGLAEGLAALDAQRGQSRSSAANHASYEAARRFAPPNGIGIFDILTDERGVVLSVTLASAPADETRWQRVGQELDVLLKERRFRVPPGAKGLAARFRIETGALAQDIAEHFRSKRGAALGQAPGAAREPHDESTRARLEPGQLSPTLGVTVAGGGSDEHIRVVLVSERAL